jgi:HEAT repeat protein
MLWWTIKQLKSSDWQKRVEIASQLGASQERKAVPALIEALGDENAQVRLAVIQALGTLRHPAAAEPLARAMAIIPDRLKSRGTGAESAEYEALAGAIGTLGSEAVPPLLRLLDSDDRETRRWAASALGLTRDSRATEPLIKRLSDPRSEVRKAAALALGEIADSRAIDPLAAALAGRDHETRRAVVIALGAIGSEKALDCLCPMVEDASEPVQLALVDAMRKIGGLRAGNCLRRLMDGSRKHVREAASAALPSLKFTPASAAERAAVAVLIGDFDGAVREGEAASDALISVLGSKDPARRRLAVETLGRLPAPSAVEPLLGVLRDYDPDVRNAAVRALVKVGHAAVDGLVGMLSHHDPTAQNLAACGLGEIGDPRAAGALAAVVEQNRTISNEFPELLDVVRSAVSALEAILVRSAAQCPEPDLRRIAGLPEVVCQGTREESAVACTRIRDLAKTQLQARQ